MDETQILDGVAATWGTTVDRLLSQRRMARLVEARKVAYYLLREMTTRSTTEIGQIMRRDHSTIISGSQSIERRMEGSDEFARMIQRLRKGLWDERGCLA